MADTPEYDESVKLEVAQPVDVQSAASMLINNFKEFSHSISGQASEVIQEDAAEKRGLIKNNISSTMQGFAQVNLNNPDASAGLKNYNIQTEQYKKQLLSQTGGMDSQYTENLLNYYTIAHRNPLVRNVITQTKRIQEVQFIDQNDRSTNDVLDAIHNSDPSQGDHQFDAAGVLASQQIKSMQNQVVLGTMDKNVYRSSLDTLTKKYTHEKILKQYQDAQDQGKGPEFLANLDKSNIPGFDYYDIQNLHSQIQQINTTQMNEAGMFKDDLNQQMKDEYKGIEDTGRIPNAELTHTVNQFAPERFQQFQLQKRMAESLYHIKQAVLGMSPTQQTNYLNSLRPKPGEKLEYPKAVYQEIQDRAVKAVDKQNKEILADPMKFTQQQPFMAQSAHNYKLSQDANAVGEHQNSSPVNNTATLPFQSAIKFQEKLGFNLTGKGDKSVRLMTNDDAKERVVQMEQSTPSQKIDYMNKMKDEFGGGVAYQLAIRQLVNAGMPAQYALLANIDPTTQAAQDVGNAFAIPSATLASDLKSKDSGAYTAFNNKISTEIYSGKAENANFQSFIESTNSYSGDKSQEFLDGMRGTVTHLASYYLLSGKENNQDFAIQRAESVIADRYNYTGIYSHTVRVPKQYVPSAIVNYATKYQANVKDFPFVLNAKDPTGSRELIDKGHWANDPVDNGLVWVNANGVVPKNKNHQPLSFTFDDAQYGPHLHEEMTDQERKKQINTLSAAEEAPIPMSANLKGNNK